jgi:hypothetical protein
LITAEQVADTLALLIPGFVALKIFYWFGQRTKRADWEWVLWSVLVSAPIAMAATWIANSLHSPQADLPKSFADCGVKYSGKTGQDLQTALESCAKSAISTENFDLRLALALTIAVIGAVAFVLVWRKLMPRFPRFVDSTSLDAWGAILRRPHWVQIKVGSLIYSGKVDVAADPVETDNLDIYITDPALISGSEVTPLSVTAGVLIARDKIDWIQVLKS